MLFFFCFVLLKIRNDISMFILINSLHVTQQACNECLFYTGMVLNAGNECLNSTQSFSLASVAYACIQTPAKEPNPFPDCVVTSGLLVAVKETQLRHIREPLK